MKSKFLVFLAVAAVVLAGEPKRPKDLSTTATAPAADDYLVIDGSTNGTRKILATDIISVGTTAGTVAAGDDSRITGAVQQSSPATEADHVFVSGGADRSRVETPVKINPATGNISGIGDVTANTLIPGAIIWGSTVVPAANGGAGTVTGILKADGAGTVSAATPGTDYAPATSGTSILAGNGSGGFSAVTIGSDMTYSGGVLSGFTNSVESVYAAGTAYSLTDSAAALDFGTTDPVLAIPNTGTWLLFGRVNLKYNGATFAANQTATIKLRRTNNTAADVPNGTTTTTLRIVTTTTDGVGVVSLPPVIYSTSNTDDSISLFGALSATPSAGSVDVTEASIVALRLFPGLTAPTPPFDYLIQKIATAPSGAYSVARRLSSTYAGPLVNLRKVTSGTTSDFGTGDNELDVAEIEAWAAGEDVAIVTLYDQSGNGRHLTQATSSNQPLLAVSGTVNLGSNNKPVLKLNDTDAYLTVSYNAAYPVTYFAVVSSVTTTNDRVLISGGSNTRAALRHRSTSGPVYRLASGATINAGSTYTNGDWDLVTVYVEIGTSDSIAINADAATPGNAGDTEMNAFRIGDAAAAADAEIGDVLFYEAALSTEDKTAIRNNINAFYTLF